MRSTAAMGSKGPSAHPPNPHEAIYALHGSLHEFPLEADLEEERRAERNRESEVDEAAEV